MEIIGFHSESELIDLLQENKINHLDFVTHMTPELSDEFGIFSFSIYFTTFRVKRYFLFENKVYFQLG